MVGGDHVELLALELAARVVLHVVGFGGETDDKGSLGHIGNRFDDVRRGFQVELDRHALLLDFLLRHRGGLKIGYGGGGDEHIRFGDVTVNRRVHVARALHVDPSHPDGGLQVHRAADHGYVRARFTRRRGDRKSHLSRAAIGEIAHGVEPLARGPGRDQHIEARQQSRVDRRFEQALRQLNRFPHTPLANFAAGLIPGPGPEDAYAPGDQCLDVRLRCLVRPHDPVHGGREHERCLGGETQRGQ